MFIQFLNDQILNLYGLPQRLGKARLASHIRRLLWSASLVSEDPLIIPTVDLVQSPVSDAVLDIVKGLAGVGLIELVGSTTDPDDFVRRKRIHFSDTGLHPEWSRLEAPNLLESVRGSLNTRNINTTEDMFDQWSASVTSIADGDALRRSRLMPIAERQLLHAYKRLPTEPSLLGFIDHAYELPRRLGDHAFLWNVVERVDAFRLPTRTEVAQSLVWMQLRDLLTNRLGLSFEEFNRISVAGLTVTDRLRQMLDASDFAFVILTGEDETAEGALRARQNVVHELGLFQGRLGFDRAIVLLEEDCEHFSNIAGLQEIRFPRNNLMAVSEEVRRVLEERL